MSCSDYVSVPSKEECFPQHPHAEARTLGKSPATGTGWGGLGWVTRTSQRLCPQVARAHPPLWEATCQAAPMPRRAGRACEPQDWLRRSLSAFCSRVGLAAVLSGRSATTDTLTSLFCFFSRTDHLDLVSSALRIYWH